jgi:hypothetical protein
MAPKKYNLSLSVSRLSRTFYFLVSSLPPYPTMPGQYVDFGGIRVDISQFDLSDTSSRVEDVRIASIVLISLVVSIIILRLYARTKIVKHIFADDGTYLEHLMVLSP